MSEGPEERQIISQKAALKRIRELEAYIASAGRVELDGLPMIWLNRTGQAPPTTRKYISSIIAAGKARKGTTDGIDWLEWSAKEESFTEYANERQIEKAREELRKLR